MAVEGFGELYTGSSDDGLVKKATTTTGVWAPPEASALLRDDVEALQNQELGLSGNEKDQFAAKQQELAGQQVGAQQTEINRQQMSSGGGFSGEYSAASQQLGGQAAQAGAQAYGQADEVSRQLAEGRRAEILGRLERQQDRSRENMRWAIDEGQDFAGWAMDYWLGGGGGFFGAGGGAGAGGLMG